MRLLFIQLPLLDHGYGYINGNVEYAPAAISSYLKKRLGDSVYIGQIPSVLSNFASNSIILRFIEKSAPQILSFTCYVWNIERNLRIARAVKLMDKGIITVFGGPEINRQSWALSLKREEVDYFVSGEGEWFFERFIGNGNVLRYSQHINGNNLIEQPANELIPSHDIEEPFTSRRLNTMADGSIFIELVRGCPYRCLYCYYSKNSYQVRQLPFDLLIHAVEKKDLCNIREIYILAPTFNRLAGIEEKIEQLRKKNRGVRLHTEMRAGGVTSDMARMLYRAGFRSLEIGIQTLNEKALRVIGRDVDLEDEIRGMIELRDAGIDLKIGLIPGLPGDTPDDFKGTLDRMIGLGFGDNLEIYPLMILPGTRIREKADSEGVLYQEKPPYFIERGWEFDMGDIVDAVQYADEMTGFSYTEWGLPSFTAAEDGILINSIGFIGDNLSAWDGKRYSAFIEANVFSFRIRMERKVDIRHGLQRLFGERSCEAELMQVIFECDRIIDERKIIDFILEYEGDNLQGRLHIFDDWRAGLRIRFYQVFRSSSFARAEMAYSLIEPILRVDKENFSFIGGRDREALPNLLVSRDAFELFREDIVSLYRDDVERIVFEHERDQEDFYIEVGHEYLKMPFSFKHLDMSSGLQ